ncbi:MAG: TlpA family protein disulfide reductase [Actinomycetota bacterium]|nr:MAG: TlpA family protein disulfide reductase [Actinomycetota bacterium]
MPGTRLRRFGRFRLVVALAVAGVALAACSTTDSPGDGSRFVAGDGSIVLLAPADRQVAPQLAGTTLAGDRFDLAAHRGEVVVLNVWASWCAPCRTEAPALQRLWQANQSRGVQVVGLNTRDATVSAEAFQTRWGVTYPSVVDADGRLQLAFHDTLPPQAIPSTLVIDQSGRVAARALGTVSESTLQGLIDPLLAEQRATTPVPVGSR